MIGDFTFLYGRNRNINDAFGSYNKDMGLKNAKKIFGGNGKVFFEYAKDSFPAIDTSINTSTNNISYTTTTTGNILVYPIGYNYEAEIINSGKNTLLDSIKLKSDKKFYAIDLTYILNITRAMTTLDFSHFTGEGKRILNAWIFVMSKGTKDQYGRIRIDSYNNEYGVEPRGRVIIRNSDDGQTHTGLYGYYYATSNDKEFALTPDDYSRVAALDAVFNELVNAKDISADGHISKNVISDLNEYGDTRPKYFDDIMATKKSMSYTPKINNKGIRCI
jgi:hypothetical protein